MFVQIEVSTKCNYGCFYCAGRDMQQKQMPWELFTAILSSLSPLSRVVSLQGEGEPMLHPRFWDMVDAVAAGGRRPYTITNGSALVDPDHVALKFKDIGISIDTLDPELAEKIGRYDLPRVLRNLDQLLVKMAPSRVLVHTVDFGQDLAELRQYLKARGLRHFVQPLQVKPDYAYRYTEVTDHGSCTYSCPVLAQPGSAYFNIEGRQLPCAFIKDLSKFESRERILAQLHRREVPASCNGCPMIFPQAGRGAHRPAVIQRFQQ
jgi:MoaA/NifB/PqqE/SkfB family radical SAM enzyme